MPFPTFLSTIEKLIPYIHKEQIAFWDLLHVENQNANPFL